MAKEKGSKSESKGEQAKDEQRFKQEQYDGHGPTRANTGKIVVVMLFHGFGPGGLHPRLCIFDRYGVGRGAWAKRPAGWREW